MCLRWGRSGGCYAEYVVAPRSRVLLRGELPALEASTYNIAYMSAYEALFVTTDLRQRQGQTIFIPGGSGGVGHFAVQLARAHGLRVLTSASKPAGLSLLRSLGADLVIDYSAEDVEAALLAATGGEGADVVFDSTYAEGGMKQSAAVVAKGGQWIRLGPWEHSRPGLQQEVEPIAQKRALLC